MPHTDCNSFEVVVPLFGNARSYYSGGEALAIPKVSLLMEGAGQQESCFTTREVKRSTKRVLYARLKPFHDGSQRKAVLSQNFGLQSLFDGGLGGMLSAGLPICHIFNVKL